MTTEHNNEPNGLSILLQANLAKAKVFSGTLRKVFSRSHKILEDGKVLSEYDPEELMEEMVSAKPILDAFEQGRSGDNPTGEITKRYLFLNNFGDIVRRNKLKQYKKIGKVNIGIFPAFDEKLEDSLLAHAYYADRHRDNYVRAIELGPADNYRKNFEKILGREEAITLVSWFFAHRFLLASRQFSFNNLKRLLYKEHSTQFMFRTKEDFFESLAASFYFFGWTRRLTGAVRLLEAQLPKSLETLEAKEIMLARLFAHTESGQIKDLIDIYTHLQNRRVDLAKEFLVNFQVRELINKGHYVISERRLENLGILNEIRKRVKQRDQKRNKEKTSSYKAQLKRIKELSPDPVFQGSFRRFETLTKSILPTLEEKLGVDLKEKSSATIRITVQKQDEKLVSSTINMISETAKFEGLFPTQLTFILQNGVLDVEKYEYGKSRLPILVIRPRFSLVVGGKTRSYSIQFDPTNCLTFFNLAFTRNWKIEILS